MTPARTRSRGGTRRAGRAWRRDGSYLVLTVGPAAASQTRLTPGVVVVGKFVTLRDVLRGPDPDDVVHHLGITVADTRVIDEPCGAAAHIAVAKPAAVQREAPDLPVLLIPGLTAVGFRRGDLLAAVLDDALVLVDGLGGIDAPPRNVRSLADDPYACLCDLYSCTLLHSRTILSVRALYSLFPEDSVCGCC